MPKHFAKVYAAELEGIRARLIEVEVDLHAGLHAFNIVGLADRALSEAKERVNSALKNTGTKPPNRENRKITVNLAPADMKKTGSQYDLAIALGYLLATKQLKEFDARNKVLIGELALDGRLRPVQGALNIAESASAAGFEYLLLPAQNANEASAIKNINVIPLESLQDAIDFLEERKLIKPEVFMPVRGEEIAAPDLAEIKGQENAKRALTIAAAGGHNLLMVGSPGVGKSMLAQAMVNILPALMREEAVEITKIYSAAGLSPGGLINERPFRSPHQTASPVSIIGGGSDPKPGEISLAHRGILFLDELPEFQRNILESLREPLESGVIRVSRAKGTIAFPAKFALVAAMNPCPCGFYGDPEKECRCSAYEVIRYQKKISGPLLDRIDLQIRVPRIAIEELRIKRAGAPASPAARKRIEAARDIQSRRFAKLKIKTNSEMSSRQTEERLHLSKEGEGLLETLGKDRLSPRGYYRLLKVAKTIADLEEEEQVSAEHLAEAFSYRLREEV